MDLGAGRRGVDMGPSAVRLAGLNEKLASLGYEVEDLGNVVVDQPENLPVGPANARYLPQIAHTCARLAEMVEQGRRCMDKCRWCSAAIIRSPSARSPECRAHFRKQDQKLGLIWIDAHADMNTPESSPSGNVHGMPLACSIGLGPRGADRISAATRPRSSRGNVAIVGLRSVDEIERQNVRDAGVHAFTMRDIDERGLRSVMQEAIELATRGHRRLSSFLRHGRGRSRRMRPASARRCAAASPIARRTWPWKWSAIAGRMTSMEMVEVNPVIDEVNRTALLAVELVMSAMGKRIL